ALQARFNLTGTTLASGDITGRIQDRLAAHHSPDFIRTFQDAMADHVRQGPYWYGAEDHLTEEGNELVESGVIDVEELLAPDSEYTCACEFHTGNGLGTVEVGGFDTAEEAFHWGLARIGNSPWMIFDEALDSTYLSPTVQLGTPVIGMALVVYSGDERCAHLPAV